MSTGPLATHTQVLGSKHTDRILKDFPYPGNNLSLLPCGTGWDQLGLCAFPTHQGVSAHLTIPDACKALCTVPPPGTFSGSPEDLKLHTVSTQQERR